MSEAAVRVGLAREELQHALLFGTNRDIKDAESELEEALNIEAASTRLRRQDSINNALAMLRETRDNIHSSG